MRLDEHAVSYSSASSSTVSTAGQSSASGMLSAGKKRITRPAVTFTSTPRCDARSDSVDARSASRSASPSSRPRPRASSAVSGCSRANSRRRASRRSPSDGRALDQLLGLDHAQHRVRGRAGQRAAAEGGAVVAERDGRGDGLAGEEGGDREAAAEPLAERHHVRNHALVLEREHPPGAPDSGLHLVEDQQRAGGVAEAAQRREIAGRRHVHAALALDRLDDEGRAVARRSRSSAARASPKGTATGSGSSAR